MKRICASILINRNGQVVKGKGFASDRVVGTPVQTARVYANIREVDELFVLFVNATEDSRGPDLGLVEAIAESCFVPVAVGGGIRTVEQAADVLAAGAEKVILGTSAYLIPGLIKQIADRFGSQAVVVSVDVRDSGINRYLVTNSGSMKQWLSPEGYAEDVVQLGAGELLVQNADRDGTLDGYDLDLIRHIASAVNVPVIASAGCSGVSDIWAAFDAGADAAVAGALWSFTDLTPAQAKHLLSNHAEFPFQLRAA